MPREILCVQVGQCGNQLGQAWWDLLLQEHKENVEFTDSHGCLFYESGAGGGPGQRRGLSGSGTLKARCVPIDMEEGVFNAMLRSPLGSLFDTAHFVSDVSGAGNNWAVGHMEYGDRYLTEIEKSVAGQLEKCDSVQSMMSSLPHTTPALP
jgi:tubulin epsilon